MDNGDRRVTKGVTITISSLGVALLGVVIASWADTRVGSPNCVPRSAPFALWPFRDALA